MAADKKISDLPTTGSVSTTDEIETNTAGGTPSVRRTLAQLREVNSQKLQTFVLLLTNTAGTIQHAVYNDTADATAPAYADKVTGVSTTLANTPSVAAGVDFTNGVGIQSGATHQIIFNTAVQTVANLFGKANVEYYDGGVTQPIPYVRFQSNNVNGTTRVRLQLYLVTPLTGANWAVNTTNIPAGKFLYIRFTGYIA